MRALLFLAIFGTIAALIAWRVGRRIVRHRLTKNHIRELEKQNAELDDFNAKLTTGGTIKHFYDREKNR